MMGLRSLVVRACAVLLVLPLLAAAPAKAVSYFATPQAGVDALVAALQANDPPQMEALFGADGMSILRSGDPVSDQTDREQFLAAYSARHVLNTKGDMASLSIGNDAWPFPIPLEHGAKGWSFDVAAGQEEILARRIGANELFTQQVLLACVDAQNEYADSLHDGSKLHVYAQHFLSSPGKQDGLYWPTASGQPQSPLGPLVADANAAGYHPGRGAEPQPFHGYFFKMLTAQGPNAASGAYNYVVNGVMIGGFAMVAWPARWDHSGVMTFIVNQDGEIYQKDLGPDTADIAKAMTLFNPDASWTKLGAPAPIPGEASDDGAGE